MSIIGPIHVRHVEGLRHEATDGKHTVVTDEPAALGGSNLGMTPTQLLLAALGSCISMTLRMYCEKKKWPLPTSLTVDVTLDRINAAECEPCETEEGVVSVFHRKVLIEGDFDAEQHARLQEIASRCPVHRTLTGAVEIFATESV